ncbi:MAG: hypothetical protein ACSHW1_01375 [Yoonia sp.]|uniref:hypothetical protein n=1 Tax=Yoonia sp. TaxID=2212373 RepID=UPI003EF999EA
MTIASMLRRAAAAALCVALAACIPQTDTVADEVSRSANKVILVGSFEITPSIPQSLNTNKRVARPLENALFGSPEQMVGNRLVTGFLPYGTRVSQSIFSSPMSGATHSVPLGELFFVEVDRTAIQLQPGQYFLSDGFMDAITLPGGLVTATHPTAQVVYVGTVRYQRDDFYAITDVRVIDRYSQAVAQARRLYGPNVSVAKSLWRRGG